MWEQGTDGHGGMCMKATDQREWRGLVLSWEHQRAIRATNYFFMKVLVRYERPKCLGCWLVRKAHDLSDLDLLLRSEDQTVSLRKPVALMEKKQIPRVYRCYRERTCN